jgi:phospholipase D3/4
VYFSNSPAPFCPPGRTFDLAAVVAVAEAANTTLCLEVMDYLPIIEYATPQRYWPYIDDALRAAAFRGVHLRLLFANWQYTKCVGGVHDH